VLDILLIPVQTSLGDRQNPGAGQIHESRADGGRRKFVISCQV